MHCILLASMHNVVLIDVHYGYGDGIQTYMYVHVFVCIRPYVTAVCHAMHVYDYSAHPQCLRYCTSGHKQKKYEYPLQLCLN